MGSAAGSRRAAARRPRVLALPASLLAAVLLAPLAPATALTSDLDDEPLDAGSLLEGEGGDDYEDPFFLNWPTFLPAGTADFEESIHNDCPTGANHCVDQVIKEMTRRYNQLGCHHDGIFAFTYLLTTEEYRQAVDDPDFFDDDAFVNHQDVVFADYYFQQHDDWRRDRLERVAPAWRIAFHVAEEQQVTGMGNILLGMNGHVNRDLPFVLADIGLTTPEGTSRKPDHDRVNDFLNEVNKYLLAEAAEVHDPTVDDGDLPGTTIDNSTMVQLLVAWREGAWRNAERLVAAETEHERAEVAREIEQSSALAALLIAEAYRYDLTHQLLGTDATARNAFCEERWSRR